MQYEQITTEYVSEEVTVEGRRRLAGLEERLRVVGVYLLYAFSALLPIWFIPWQTGVQIGREITFGIIIVLTLIVWILSALIKGEIRWIHSLTTYAAFFMLAIFGISAVFSRAPYYSALFSDSVGERLSVLALGVLLFILIGGVFRSRRELWNAVFVMMVAGALGGVVHLLQLVFGLSLYQLIVPFGAGNHFNVIGTANAPALFYAVLFVIGLGLVRAASRLKAWVRYLLWVALVVFFLNILLISFQTAWIILLGTGIIFFGFTFRTVRTGGVTIGYIAALGIIVLSIVMILIGRPLFDFAVPAEVAPSLRSTIAIGKSVAQEGIGTALLGSGPGTFGIDWGLYKPPAINQEIVWNAHFNQGYSWVATLFPTVGALGVLAFLIFIGVSLFFFLRALLSSDKGSPLSIGAFLGFSALVITVFLYPVNLTFVLLIFFLAGILSFLFSDRDEAGGEGGEKIGGWRSVMGGMRMYSVRLTAPWAVFLSSLVMISLLSFSVVALYGEGSRLRSGFLQHAGLRALERGEFDIAVEKIQRAAEIEPRHLRLQQALVQARTRKIQNLIQRASQGEDVIAAFQGEVSRADADARRVVQFYPFDVALWRTRGSMYEQLIPFIAGSERATFESYQKASELDPLNPSIYSDWGRAGLVYIDRLRFLVDQVGGQERVQLESLRTQNLGEVTAILNRSVELKPDFATGHFLLSQAAIRLNNIQSAIESTENAKQSAPFDIGIAFQLGLLYYQNDNLDRAQAEFERAVVLNTDYSNARYFLGLIYDRRGNASVALQQFQRIAELNPDNEEVQKIISNLQSGRDALAGIVPPAAPPEDRSAAPVR